MSLVTSQEKAYCDKNVQTDVDFPLQNLGQVKSVPQALKLSMATIPHQVDHFQGISLTSGVAYTYSEASLPWSISPKLSPDLPHSRTRHLPQHPQHHYSYRPSESGTPTQRVVSLPCVLPEAPSKISCSSKLRVVSLPELANRQSSESPSDGYSSPEYITTSADNSYHSSRNGSVHQRTRTFSISDMPATPSPPESPESLLAADKDSDTRRSLLNQSTHYGSSVYDAEDDCGWITWASSPPKPILALHGPLSLPYARCPSGAEGTILEDADSRRMIWGLDLQQSTRTRNLLEMPVPKPQPWRRGSETLSSLALQTSVTKPGLPFVHTHCVGQCTGAEVRSPLMSDVCDAEIQLKDFQINISKFQGLVSHKSPIVRQALGTGFHGNNSDVVDLTLPAPQLEPVVPNQKTPILKSSAPIFSPRTQTSQCTFAGILVESYTRPRTMSSDQSVTQNHRIESQQSYLPTPPNSSEPQWSSAFSRFNSSTDQCQRDLHQALPELSGRHQGSPPMIDLSEQLRYFAARRAKKRPEIGHMDTVPLVCNTMDRAKSQNSPYSSSDLPFRYSSVDVSPIFKQCQASPGFDLKTTDTPSLAISSAPMSRKPISSSMRDVLNQSPQSIPLAKLIQRRLSSVAEESTQSTATHIPRELWMADPAIYRTGPFLGTSRHPLSWEHSRDQLERTPYKNFCVDQKTVRTQPPKNNSEQSTVDKCTPRKGRTRRKHD